MTGSTGFVPADVALLLERYAGSEDAPRQPPWCWPALNHDERLALTRMCQVYVASYNTVHAVTETELVPPCWVLHPGLAAELAVQVWLYYAAHLDPKATPLVAGEWYGRHLPGFRSRIERLLGRNARQCAKGDHDPEWRKDIDARLASFETHDHTTDQVHDLVELLGAHHFGFPPPRP